MEKGKFKKGKKHGQWINYVSKDTIQFKNGEVFIPKPKLTKEEKIIAKETKAKEKEALQLQKEQERALKKANKEKEKLQDKKGNSKATPKEKNKKENFFTRLFSKKEK